MKQYAGDREVSETDCVLEAGAFRVKGVPGSETALAAVVSAAMASGGPVAATGRFQPSSVVHDQGCVTGWLGALHEPTFHCHAVELEVDLDTGHVEILRYAAVHDTGPVLNPHGARGQVVGGVVQGIGYTLSEVLEADETGRVRNANLHDYRVPTIKDVPDDVHVSFVENHPAVEGYMGVKGVGEAPAIPGASAIGSAIRDALGRQPASCSMTPEVILRLIDGIEPTTTDDWSVR
jgi:CO/xanthine dehydrogenase Mo-binding subunit